MSINLILICLNAIAFFYYGIHCIFSSKMVEEFSRYGLSDIQRQLTGALQILGALGVLVGILAPLVGVVASAGLTALMLLGFGVRLKIRDSVLESLPSFIFMLLNFYLFYYYYLALWIPY